MLILCGGAIAGPKSTAAMSRVPAYVYLLQKTDLYAAPSASSKPFAALSAGQFVKVVGADTGTNRDFDWEYDIQWLKVETWIGDKWIRLDAETMTSGKYEAEDRTLTLIAAETLYDRPDGRLASDRTIEPQMIHVTAAFEFQPVHFTDAMSLIMMSGEKWYRADTADGPQWLRNPKAPELVQEKPFLGTVKLTGPETAYPYPFAIQDQAESAEPQVVQSLARWTAGIGPGEVHWLKIRLPQGDRWIVPQHPVWTDYRVLNEKLELKTDAKTYSEPMLAPTKIITETYPFPAGNPQVGKEPLKAGSYEAFEASEDWVHIHTPDRGDVWVNPQQALLERPVGTVPTAEKVQLTQTDEYYDYPNSPFRVHAKGFYKPQTVTAFEKWTAPDGTVWYRFHGLGADEWVKRPGVKK